MRTKYPYGVQRAGDLYYLTCDGRAVRQAPGVRVAYTSLEAAEHRTEKENLRALLLEALTEATGLEAVNWTDMSGDYWRVDLPERDDDHQRYVVIDDSGDGWRAIFYCDSGDMSDADAFAISEPYTADIIPGNVIELAQRIAMALAQRLWSLGLIDYVLAEWAIDAYR